MQSTRNADVHAVTTINAEPIGAALRFRESIGRYVDDTHGAYFCAGAATKAFRRICSDEFHNPVLSSSRPGLLRIQSSAIHTAPD